MLARFRQKLSHGSHRADGHRSPSPPSGDADTARSPPFSTMLDQANIKQRTVKHGGPSNGPTSIQETHRAAVDRHVHRTNVLAASNPTSSHIHAESNKPTMTPNTPSATTCFASSRMPASMASFARMLVALASLTLFAQLVVRGAVSTPPTLAPPTDVALALGRAAAVLELLDEMKSAAAPHEDSLQLQLSADAAMDTLDEALALPPGCHVRRAGIPLLKAYLQQIGDIGHLRGKIAAVCRGHVPGSAPDHQ